MSAEVFDCLNALLLDHQAVAIVCKQALESVEGPAGVIFPPSYPGKTSDDGPTYNISTFADGRNICTIDSVQSQANRIEAAFLQPPYRALVRAVSVKAQLADGEVKDIDVLQAPHRLADATLRFSDLREAAEEAFKAFRSAPAGIAKLSPMSLLLGAWDSRGTQSKIPRAFTSRIDAYNVHRLQRHALYSAALTSKEIGNEENSGTLSKVGLDSAPSGPSPAGVVADGGVRRDSVLNLIALRQNCQTDLAGATPDALSAYLFGLGLVALTLQPEAFLRQGCLLVAAGPVEAVVRMRDGCQTVFALTADEALAYAQAAAERFGVAELEPITAQFQPELIVEKEKKGKAKKGAKESAGA